LTSTCSVASFSRRKGSSRPGNDLSIDDARNSRSGPKSSIFSFGHFRSIRTSRRRLVQKESKTLPRPLGLKAAQPNRVRPLNAQPRNTRRVKILTIRYNATAGVYITESSWTGE
jgi:hypothetical protein